MPSERSTLAYRPDPVERAILDTLAKKQGLSLSRTIGQAVRRFGEQEGVGIGEIERRLEEARDGVLNTGRRDEHGHACDNA